MSVLPVIILGNGGHAKVCCDLLMLCSVHIIGFVSPEPSNETYMGVRVIGDDPTINQYQPDEILLVNGIGSITQPVLREQVFNRFKDRDYSFLSLIHPSSVIASNVQLGEGVQVMAGSIIQTGVRIGKNTIINTKSSIDHHSKIGDHVHISPGVTICGEVNVEDGVHIGAGSTIIQGLQISKNSIVGAGSLVLKEVKEGAKVYGVPAKEAHR
ncbi:acetyltransferase [Paenibacillus sepulcri]|uniref:Acetyltransferase n=2 Tax=Paenibacillus sepulcri TaxID=359917 RepID=A0ABS7BV21_9BACL|nr:acetyltransferase [Paenibacillus sepulcri]